MKPIKMFEIGLGEGSSMRMWNNYWAHPDARIYGLENRKKFEIPPRVLVEVGDQGEEEALKHMCSFVPEGFDLIIDDGSHWPEVCF